VARPHLPDTRRPPRRRGIQYAVAYRFDHRCLWFVIASEAKQSIVRHKERLDCFASLAMTAVIDARSMATTADMISRSRGMNCPRFASSFTLFENRAQGRPGGRCTRGLVCNCAKKTRTRAYRSSGEHPAFPAQWFYGVLRALPGVRIPLATVVSGLTDGAGPVGPAHPPQT
jgi:hypothetical protein